MSTVATEDCVQIFYEDSGHGQLAHRPASGLAAQLRRLGTPGESV